MLFQTNKSNDVFMDSNYVAVACFLKSVVKLHRSLRYLVVVLRPAFKIDRNSCSFLSVNLSFVVGVFFNFERSSPSKFCKRFL